MANQDLATRAPESDLHEESLGNETPVAESDLHEEGLGEDGPAVESIVPGDSSVDQGASLGVSHYRAGAINQCLNDSNNRPTVCQTDRLVRLDSPNHADLPY
jgi:hypothetical protein